MWSRSNLNWSVSLSKAASWGILTLNKFKKHHHSTSSSNNRRLTWFPTKLKKSSCSSHSVLWPRTTSSFPPGYRMAETRMKRIPSLSTILRATTTTILNSKAATTRRFRWPKTLSTLLSAVEKSFPTRSPSWSNMSQVYSSARRASMKPKESRRWNTKFASKTLQMTLKVLLRMGFRIKKGSIRLRTQ